MPEAILSMSALMRKVNRPRLRMLIGRVTSSAIGLKKAFRIPSMAAAKTAERKPLTWIPSSKYAVATIAAVVVSQRIKMPGMNDSH
jgi:hypothetical protein